MPYLASKPARFSEAVSTHRRMLQQMFERDGRLGPDEQEVLAFLLDLQGEMEGLDSVSNYCAALVKYGEPSQKAIRRLRETARDLERIAEAAG